jgi:catechol 2,3-dioxygenase-like lactoylglutathione lyase family enzyme
MKTRWIAMAATGLFLAGCLVLLRPGVKLAAAAQDPRAHAEAGAVLVNTCLITKDVRGLAAFYARVLRVEPQWNDGDYVEFHTGGGVLALFSADAQEIYIPGSAAPAQNRSAILEFRVRDVDHEYERLQKMAGSDMAGGVNIRWVKAPSTQPCGTRSIYFRDPDGNLVDFFMPARNR